MSAIPNPDATDPDFSVPWHFGDPFREQRALLAGAAVVDLGNREVLEVVGPDRRTWLNSLTTQDLLGEWQSAQALILSPHGHIEHDLHLADDGERTLIGVEPGYGADLLQFLTTMRFRSKVEVRDASADFSVVGALAQLENHLAWRAPQAFAVGAHDDKYVPLREFGWPAIEYFVPRAEISAVLSAHDSAGSWAWNALRVLAGVPRLGLDTDHRSLPHELGLVAAAVHMNKGCYRGQETVARVYNLGRPPRRLALLEFDGDLPDRGAPVLAGGAEVGQMGSVVQHYEHGPIGLAVIKRATDTQAQLSVGGILAAQHPIVQV